MKGKKLPDLFVQFKDGVAWGTYYKRENGKDDGDKFTVARYTPAKPAKQCRWKELPPEPGEKIRLFETCVTGESRSLIFSGGQFCSDCGGKIKVTR